MGKRCRRCALPPHSKNARSKPRNLGIDPAHVCVGFNEAAIRADLRQTLQAAQNQPLAFVMKDTHTVEHDPSRLPRWAQIAREEISR